MTDDILRFGQAIAVMATDRRDTPMELVPLPPDAVEIEMEKGRPVRYSLGEDSWPASKIFHVYDELPACSPLESVRDVLREDVEANLWRIGAWQKTPTGVVERSLESPEWSGSARERFQASFANSLKQGSRGGDVIPVVEDGMTYKDVRLPDSSAMQVVESRRMVVDIVCDVYGIQSALLATGSDRVLATAQKHLLLGTVTDITKKIQLAYANQIATRQYGAHGTGINIYYDIQGAIQKLDEDPQLTLGAVGAPYRTPNEARIAEGREPLPGGDSLAQPTVRNVVTTP
jgi:HK97 family phage portal protein